jgi:ABC-type multidrug transport system ATPase subunit/predicted component of type VI protein secretion system
MVSHTIAKFVLQDGSPAGKELELTLPEMVIGRDASADMVIDSPAVSRRHLRVISTNGQVRIEDLGSSNGTFVNGVRLTAPHTLQPGDVVQLGRAVSLTYVAPGRSVEPAAAQIETREEAGPGLQGMTVLASDLPPAAAGTPPRLVVTVAGSEPQTVDLTLAQVRLGRSPDNDVVIDSPIVSGHHAVLERGEDGYRLKVEAGTKNPVLYHGAPVAGDQALRDGDVLRIGSLDPGVMVTLFYEWPAEAALGLRTRHIAFGESSQLQIGRDPSNDIALDAPTVSRYHAVIERVGQRYRVRDQRSANGTFVNDQRIEGETWLAQNDSLRIGPYRFELDRDQLAQFDESGGLQVEVLGLNKWVRKDLNLLKNISLLFRPREMIVVVGQSGGGKSTLVDAIAGYRPASQGQVLVNGVDIYKHFDAVRDQIGFVPQKDIIHTELTVYQALDYAARLRMPADTSPEERHQRVTEVLQDLDLVHRKDVQISGLSGGQQKRVSIGVELLTRPGLFFLDEPTSGLDPGTETALMHLLRRLADQGRTIIVITHATKNVMLADKVLFVARGGYLAWFGPPDEALRFFDQVRSERDRRTRPMEFDEIYAVLDDASKGKAEDWAQRYQASTAYRQYIVEPLKALGRDVESGAAAAAVAAPLAAPPVKPDRQDRSRRVSGWRQFGILSSRNLKILMRDRAGLILMLVSAPLVGMLDAVESVMLGRDLFSYEAGNMANAVTTLFNPVIFAIMIGALAMVREFVKEGEVFKRERLVNLKLLPYVLSKISLALILALYQGLVYVAIHYLVFKMPGGVTEFLLMYVTLVLATLSGMMIGLLASAVSPNANMAPLLAILLIIPQFVFAGALFPVPRALSAPISASWGFQSMVAISGAGSDVAGDACWQLPAEERDALTLEEKEARGCTCMGPNALDQASCNFPGLGQLDDPTLDASAAADPTQLGIARAAAVSRAESVIDRFNEDFGWAFADKDSPSAYRSALLTSWGAQVPIIVAFFGLIMVAMARKRQK